jgi:hypothetical protein
MDSSKLWRMLKSSPAYGRLTKENGGPRSVPTGPSSLPKKPPAASNSIQGGQNNLQPSQLVRNKAVARKVSAEKVQAAYEEKQKLVKSHFSDQSKEWQHWFVGATLWGHLCMF